MGRSRKPLWVQAHRGFKSHPLRHFQQVRVHFAPFAIRRQRRPREGLGNPRATVDFEPPSDSPHPSVPSDHGTGSDPGAPVCPRRRRLVGSLVSNAGCRRESEGSIDHVCRRTQRRSHRQVETSNALGDVRPIGSSPIVTRMSSAAA
jgi:hypothetical protein